MAGSTPYVPAQHVQAFQDVKDLVALPDSFGGATTTAIKQQVDHLTLLTAPVRTPSAFDFANDRT